MKRGALFVLYACALATSARADDLFERQAQALAEIRKTAVLFCPDVPNTSRATKAEAKAQVDAALPGLMKKLLNLNIGASANISATNTSGVVQEQLADLISKNSQCRLSVLVVLQKMVPTDSTPAASTSAKAARPVIGPKTPVRPAVTSASTVQSGPTKPFAAKPAPTDRPVAVRAASPAKSGPVIRVFWKNNITRKDLVALAELLPTYDVQTGKSEIDPSEAADTLFVNRDRVTTNEVLGAIRALNKLGVPIKTVQQMPVGGRREIQVGTVISEDPAGNTPTFKEDTPLELAHLEQLRGSDFWREALNGIALCPDGIGMSHECEIGKDGRPVERRP